MDNVNKEKICPYCKAAIKPDDNVVQCSACEMPHHMECWVENEGCTTFGCNGTIQAADVSAYGTDFDIDVYDEQPKAEIPNFCGNCGAKTAKDALFCIKCGASLRGDTKPAVQTSVEPYPVAVQNETNDSDVQNNKWIALCSYLGIFVLIPLLAKPDSPFARFHANQGLLCLILSVAVFVLGKLPAIGGIINVIGFLAVLAFSINGIINCVNGEMKELPLLGKYRILK